MIDFLIFYEVGVREFESIALLGYELKKRGYRVEYLGFEETDHNKYIKNRKLLKSYYNNVDTVLMPSLYNNKEIYDTVYYVCGTCKHIVNLRWEQYFENQVMEDLSNIGFPQKLAKKAYHLCWGRKSYESLKARGINEKYIPITGALQMDFLRPEFAGFYECREKLYSKYGLDCRKKTILYISSFGTATMTERLLKKVENDFEGQYRIEDDTFRFHRKSYEITVDWIEKFLDKYSDLQFVYRPHPSENITDYVTKLNSYNNFSIILGESVKQWILCSDVITTWVSTSISEVYFAGRKGFIIRPIPYPRDIDICLYNNAKFIECLDDFLHIIDTEQYDSICADTFRYFYEYDEKKASYITTADVLERVYQSNDTFQWDECLARKFERKRKILFVRNVVFIIYFLILKFGVLLNVKYGIKFGRKIQARVDNLKTALNYSEKKKASTLDQVIYRVESYMETKNN